MAGGFFAKVFRRRDRVIVEVSLGAPTGRFVVHTVGESHYQDAIEGAAGGRTDESALIEKVATLIPEPANPYDGNAVSVWIDGRQVGYLSRANAAAMQGALLRACEPGQDGIACSALIVGGWDRGESDRGHFGVRLFPDLDRLGLDVRALEGEWESDRAPLREEKPYRPPRRPDDPGLVDGRHYTELSEDVRRLRRAGEEEAAEELLLRIVEATEREARVDGHGVAPWSYEQLAIIYRKRRDRGAEVAILERFAAAPKAPGMTPPRLLERLEKARAALEASTGPESSEKA